MSIFVEQELLGCQTPRISLVPAAVDYELGERALDLAAEAGMDLDEWQQFALRTSMARTPGDKWAAKEVGVNAPRQNGKDAILELRELAEIDLMEDRPRLVIHSAHLFDTSLEHFQRVLEMLDRTPRLNKKVKARGVSWSHGQEGIKFRNGSRIRFRTRTKGGGRGFSCDLLMLNEAMDLPEASYGALLPTLSARPDYQIWYTGSAVDQEVHLDGVVFARVRERGIEGSDASLFYVEWSVEGEDPSDVPEDVIDNREAWATANPGLGIRISPQFVEMERRALASRTFAVERLGIGDWPPTSLDGVISMASWAALVDKDSQIDGSPRFAVDTTPDRSRTTIAAAGRREDGKAHLEVVDRRPGTDWVVERLVQLYEDHDSDAVVLDAHGPVGSLLPALQRLGVLVHTVTAGEHAQGCGLLVDAVAEGTVRHLGTPELASALKGAIKRPLGDAWAWSRKSSTVDITPLVACTLALWGLETQDDGPMIEVFR